MVKRLGKGVGKVAGGALRKAMALRRRKDDDATAAEAVERVRLAREVAALLPRLSVEAPFAPESTVLAVRAGDRAIGDGEDSEVVRLEWFRSTPGGFEPLGQGYAGGFYTPNADDVGVKLCVKATMRAPTERDIDAVLRPSEQADDSISPEDAAVLRASLAEIAAMSTFVEYGPLPTPEEVAAAHRSFVSTALLLDGLCHTHADVELALRCGSQPRVVLGFTEGEVIVYERAAAPRPSLGVEEVDGDGAEDGGQHWLEAGSESAELCGEVIARVPYRDLHISCDVKREVAFVLAAPFEAPDDEDAYLGVPLLAGGKLERDALVLGTRALRAKALGSVVAGEGD
eukprot:CAMPEP_0118866686 /NCGR_PEP_ID=MMETSP1163-20130328/10512_1 /TAXON_ID=124430 /ORGANISM="Phaeomonas parva, Strain CCMP2877" /LENGTH=342 /DNA_ID=CAMNT_0006801023 /DNA_START=3 /DNA_END=1028 /DNA_ORIENTATION=-